MLPYLSSLWLVQTIYLLTRQASASPIACQGRFVSRRFAANNTYDFIVVGGGLTGLVVADRLTENPNTKVLVIEAGPADLIEGPGISTPGILNVSAEFYNDTFSVPQENLNDKSFLAPAGKVLGGGSVVNTFLWFRSTSQEYNGWSKLGSGNLSWKALLPYFKRSENFGVPDPDFARKANISYRLSTHGHDGPIHVSYPNFYYQSSGNWWEAARSTGLHPVRDLNDGCPAGISTLTFSINPENRARSDAKTGYLFHNGAVSRPNYHILTDHSVSKVVVKDSNIRGVHLVPTAGGPLTTISARKEVLLAAGGLHTPQILQLSGIGSKRFLEGLGIRLVADLPGVGTNLQDTPFFVVPYDVANNSDPSETTFQSNSTYDMEQYQAYMSNHTGPYVLPKDFASNIAILPLQNLTSDYLAIIKEAEDRDPASFLPVDTDPTVLAGYQAQRKIRLEQLRSRVIPASFLVWNSGSGVLLFLSLPLSRGFVGINSTNVLDAPITDWRSMTDPTDFKVAVAGVLRNRNIMNAPAMSSLGARELPPFGDNITDFETLRSALSTTGSPTLAHMCCTAPQMERKLGGVVDSNYKVHGVEGLRVIDIAALPLLPTLPPQALLYAAAERIADLIKQEYALS